LKGARWLDAEGNPFDLVALPGRRDRDIANFGIGTLVPIVHSLTRNGRDFLLAR